MNLLEKLDTMEHNDTHNCDLTGCTCGLDEVRAAVRELVKAVDDVLFRDYSDWSTATTRLNDVVSKFRDAQDDAG